MHPTKHQRETTLNLERIWAAWLAKEPSAYTRLGKRLRWRELYIFLCAFMPKQEAQGVADKIKEIK